MTHPSPPVVDDGRQGTVTFIQCGSEIECEHQFEGWREFEDGLGGEAVCSKCGMGAMEDSLWKD